MKLACQEHIIPGDTDLDKWRAISALGYQGIELRGSGDDAFTARLPALRDAVRNGARYPSICGILKVFVGDFDAEKRREAIGRLKVLLSGAAELGAAGVISPAAYGIHSNVLPPHQLRRPPEEDEAILIDGFGELGEHARKEGVTIFIEPLNRYEDHMLNRLEQGVSICEKIGLPSVKIMADIFHMNVEEADIPAALVAAQRWVGHLHAADSNRYQPGAGHTDFHAIGKALEGIRYDGFVALECRIKGAAHEALRNAARTLAAA